MAIVKMKRLRLIGMAEDREELLEQLQHAGCVELSQPDEQLDDPAWERPTRAAGAALLAARAREASLNAALDTLDRYVPAKTGGIFSRRPEVAEGTLFAEETALAAEKTARVIDEAQKELTAAEGELARLQAQRQVLLPWAPLDVPLDLQGTREVSFTFGAVPARTNVGTLQAELAEQSGLCQLEWAGQDKEQRYLLVIFHKSVESEVFDLLRRHEFVRSSLKGWTGTAAENLARLDEQRAELEARIEALRTSVAAQAEHRMALELGIDQTAQVMARGKAEEQLLESRATFFLEGWFPAPEEQKLTEALKGFLCAWETAEPTEEEYPQVPIQLKNNPVTAPFNVITEMYSMPAYDGVDPNPLMAPFFILFFGFMMNDIGYGLLMALGTVLYLKLAEPRGNTRKMMTMFFMCGLSSIFWGCLTGSFFGDFLPKLFQLLGISDDFVWFWPPLFTPINDIILVMVGSMALGVIQVFTGMAVSMAEKFRHGQVLDAVSGEIAWWIILGGAAMAICSTAVAGAPAALGTAGLVVLAVGLALLLAGNLIRAGGLSGIVGFGGDIYNGVSGYFSDILSYLRLMALMMAGSIIASVFNTLGSVFGLVPFLIVAIIGNALNLVLNLLGCYVHTMRLQCLEFFGRFYKDGGKAFRPLTVETKYVDVLKEEL